MIPLGAQKKEVRIHASERFWIWWLFRVNQMNGQLRIWNHIIWRGSLHAGSLHGSPSLAPCSSMKGNSSFLCCLVPGTVRKVAAQRCYAFLLLWFLLVSTFISLSFIPTFQNSMIPTGLAWEEMLYPLYQKYKNYITWGDQDLLNIIFYFNPGTRCTDCIL